MSGCCFPVTLDRSRKGSFKLSKSSSFGSSKRSSLGKRENSKGPLIVCFGEILVDLVPAAAGVSLADATSYKKSPGGAPANVAIAISRLGGLAAFIGKVGEDEFGYMLADILKQNGVDSSGMRFDANARTSLTFVALNSDGKHEFIFYRNPSADMLLRAEELDVNLIKKASIFHYGSISLIREPCRSAHLVAMNVAKKSGIILSYDPNLRLPLWPSADAARRGIMSIWDYADIIKVSKEEIEFLIEHDPNDDNVVTMKLFRHNLKLLLVTEGENGCRYYTKDFRGRVSGVKVEVVDTTGAGDSFFGGFLSILAAHKDIHKDERRLREAIAFANACGAATVNQRGAIPALPTKDAVLRLLFQNPI
ncbi:hypothetical protein L6164_000845 [Bauhinia variegata]|uniref:Uncharacterized protein n=1 Tax=Bauhinia variegata TaxID=167791 RepID=A0ACB9Q7P4_BAUVA|nr:hypothetical protein L6164_000845 [Bauhinia variegata]